VSSKTRQEKLDDKYMHQAMSLAMQAAQAFEVPVGAVVVLDDAVIGYGINRTVRDCDPSAHAEVVALREAAKRVGNHRLLNATLYVTLEPCVMCCGCLQHARIARLVFGAREPRTGAVVSVNEVLSDRHALHKVSVSEGIMAEESQRMLQTFFRQRRGSVE